MNLHGKTIVVTSHVLTPGIAHDLRDYLLLNDVKALHFIHHPLYRQSAGDTSGHEIYLNRKIYKYNTYKCKLKFPLCYIEELFLNIWWCIKNHKTRIDVFIGIDNLNALAGLFLKWAGYVDTVVYYVIDYDPKKYKNRILNSIYHWIDQVCVRNCEHTWNLSLAMVTARQHFFKFIGGNQITVPIGIYLKDFAKCQSVDFANTAVYMGTLEEKQGVQHVIRAIPEIRKRIYDFKLLIIGDGRFATQLKKLTQELELEECVVFSGFIGTNQEVIDLLDNCAIGIALYERFTNGKPNITLYTDPGKIKFYLAAGLPIITTDVPHNALLLEKMSCARIVELTSESIAHHIVSLMSNKETLLSYKSNAKKYASNYDWKDIYNAAFIKLKND